MFKIVHLVAAVGLILFSSCSEENSQLTSSKDRLSRAKSF